MKRLLGSFLTLVILISGFILRSPQASATTPYVANIVAGKQENVYAENDIPGLTYEEPDSGLYILGYMTQDILHPFYYVPDDDVFREIDTLMSAIEIQELSPFWWEGTQPLRGCYLVHDGTLWEIWSDGYIVSRMTQNGGYAKAPELNEKLLTLTRDVLGITQFKPDTIRGIVSAKLDVKFSGDDREYTQTLTDSSALADIEEILSGAVQKDVGACPFHEAFLTLKLASGEDVLLAMASDSCRQYMVNGLGFDYKSAAQHEKEDSGSNMVFYKYFDQIPMETRGGALIS
jgi:hypothetical protein